MQVDARDCAAAMLAAGPRLEAWQDGHAVTNVRCAPPHGAPLDVSEVAPGLFVHTGRIEEPSPANSGDVSNIVIVVGQEGVAVVDSGGSRAMGERIVATVRSLTDLPISFVILTHMHPDHVFGATALVDAGAEVIGHHALAQALAARADSYGASFLRLIGDEFAGTEMPVPDQVIAGEMTIDLGGRALRIEAWPTAHTPTDVTVWDEMTGTLIAGDLVFDAHAPALDGSLAGWWSTLDQIDEEGPTHVVPGHGAASLPWPEGGAPLRRYLSVLDRDTRDALDSGLTLSEAVEIVAQSESTSWQLFDLFNPRNATAAYTELEWE